MDRPLRILFVEDVKEDAELIERELRKAEVDFVGKRVETKESFVEAITSFVPDLILSDFKLPRFDGHSALELTQELVPETPFIFVSGTIGEEQAVESLKKGAADYVLKDRLARLIPALRRALLDAEARVKRRQAEEVLRKTEEQLRLAQKMEAVGRLASGVAHDFNNMLTVILWNAEIAGGRLEPENSIQPYIHEIARAAERAASLTSQLLAFSRKQVLEPRVLNLNSAIKDMEKMLRRLIGEDVDLGIRLEPQLGRIKADPGQIEQVIMNLAVNSRDAMPDGGRLLLETSNVELDADYAAHHVAVRPGAYVLLAITDTGDGMDQTTQTKIFEPFFTTKELGRGTGLGLSTVYGIVKQSGGNIWVYSEPRHGTSFKIYLPQVEEVPEPDRRAASKTESFRGSETILVAEDEAMLRSLTCIGLRTAGYSVLEARNGQEALQLAAEHSGPIHLLVTDVVMPGMSGRELSERLLGLRPETAVLFMSGYTDDTIAHHGMLKEGVVLLQKPFTSIGLLRKLRGVLESKKRTEPGPGDRHA